MSSRGSSGHTYPLAGGVACEDDSVPVSAVTWGEEGVM